jgi:hypothetical protein
MRETIEKFRYSTARCGDQRVIDPKQRLKW